jgi:hypothetical protein
MPIDIVKPFLALLERADRSTVRPNGSEKASPAIDSPREH